MKHLLDTINLGSIGKLSRPRLLLMFLALSVPVSTVLFYLLWHAESYERRLALEELQGREWAYLELQQVRTRDLIDAVIQDVRFLHDMPGVESLLEGDDTNRDELEQVLVALSRAHGVYDQLRYLDRHGMEVMRINGNQGAPAPVPKKELQDKRGRYYFTDVIGLDPGQIYLSPLDLNIDWGVIERPLKPMLRIGMPVYNGSGTPMGVVLVNYLAENLLGFLARSASQSVGDLLLLNRDGYYLKGRVPEDEWGFMFQGRADCSFAENFPREWDAMGSMGDTQGQFRTENGLFTYAVVRPLADNASSATGSPLAMGASARAFERDEYRLFLVSHVPRRLLAQFETAWDLHAQLGLLVLVSIMIGAALLAYALEAGRFRLRKIQRIALELDDAKRRAEAANTAKSMFLANMSHELRTPLNGIMGILQLVREAPSLDTESRNDIEIALSSGRRLTLLISDILDLSSIDAGRITLVKAPFSLAETLDTVDALFLPAAQEKGLALRVSAAPELPETLLGDDQRLRQILINLVGNAIKFTQTGGVGLIAALNAGTAADADTLSIAFTVSDTGIGISPEDMDRIFHPFEQVDGSLARVHQGAGLGLTITRQLVALMGGDIQVDSKPGEGTAISLRIPFRVHRERSA